MRHTQIIFGGYDDLYAIATESCHITQCQNNNNNNSNSGSNANSNGNSSSLHNLSANQNSKANSNNSGNNASSSSGSQSNNNNNTNMQTLNDEYGVFGEYVAITIRKLKTPKSKIVIKHLINNLLYEAEMGKYDHGMPSSKEPPQLYKM
uniref:Uncharacterized protein n=1 Tax=Bactrocera dorsalis TaxID=27457 RepID=A0A034VFC3_BACDO